MTNRKTPKDDVTAQREAVAEGIRKAAVAAKPPLALTEAVSLDLAAAALDAAWQWQEQFAEAGVSQGQIAPAKPPSSPSLIGTWVPTYRSKITSAREVWGSHADGTLVWRQAGRGDLEKRRCSSKAFEAWRARFRAKLKAQEVQAPARGRPHALTATVYAIFGAGRAMPGRSASFDLAPYLRNASAEDIAAVRAAGWNQDGDGDFLMDAVLGEDSGAAGDNEVSAFMADMATLREEAVDEVCWRVRVDPAVAESWLKDNMRSA